MGYDLLRLSSLLPTFVGVFLGSCIASSTGTPPPHVRGGVSRVKETVGERVNSSPRSWGCFPRV